MMLAATLHRNGEVTMKDPDNKMVDASAVVGSFTMTGSKEAPMFRFQDNYRNRSPMYPTQKELRKWIVKNTQPIMKK